MEADSDSDSAYVDVGCSLGSEHELDFESGSDFEEGMDIRKGFIDFASDNPYPSYEEMLRKLDGEPPLYAEYGVSNHELCKDMYDSGFDNETCVRVGEAIARSGGFQAMQSNFHTIFNHSPVAMWEYGRELARLLEFSWQGIGGWTM